MVNRDPGVLGDVHEHQFTVGANFEMLRVVEIDRASDEVPFEPGRRIVRSRDGHVRGLALVDGLGAGEGSAALPPLGQTGISGIGERPRSDIRSDVDGIDVDPVDVGLGLGKVEAGILALGSEELALVDVELANDRRVCPAAGEADQCTVAVWP